MPSTIDRATLESPPAGLGPGRARRLIVPDGGDLLGLVAGIGAAQSAGVDSRVVTVRLDRLGSLQDLIGRILTELAEVARGLWPGWHGSALGPDVWSGPRSSLRTRLTTALAHDPELSRRVSPPWVAAAVGRLEANRIPLPRDFTDEVHARQLIAALGPGPVAVVVHLTDPHASGPPLSFLARAAEWLSHAAGVSSWVVVPDSIVDAPELAPLGIAVRAPGIPGGKPDPEDDGEDLDRIYPVVGRPHPFSPGEQLLAKKLADDPELGPLFGFNQSVITRQGNRFVADLLWSAGKLDVEVDGHRQHMNAYAFSRDRRRDYELQTSGYLVLRLPHDEVMEDVAMAIGKIREMVRLRRPGGIPS